MWSFSLRHATTMETRIFDTWFVGSSMECSVRDTNAVRCGGMISALPMNSSQPWGRAFRRFEEHYRGKLASVGDTVAYRFKTGPEYCDLDNLAMCNFLGS